jgi:hypothetical protein
MSNKPMPTPVSTPQAQPTDDDEGPTGKTLIDPFTGQRIFTPKRAQLIEEELERMKQKREQAKGKPADEQ